MTGVKSGVKTLVLVAALALLPTGCGGNAEDAYCAALKSDQTIFADDGTGLVLITNLPTLEKLAAKAPDDLNDEWQTFTSALTALRDAVTAAGLKPTDFVDGKPPAGISASARTAIAQAANELANDDVVTAASGIEQQAKDVCKLQLGL
jgi:hypothetical protein